MDLTYTLGHPYLVNFASVREDTASTDLSLEQHENEWYLNVYRYPARQGTNIVARFTMAHDTYSLGVVLLEIGLWRPVEKLEAEISGKTLGRCEKGIDQNSRWISNPDGIEVQRF
jgi:hypothetical protein